MTLRTIALGLLAGTFGVLALGGVAYARNPHCAGGIQYVVQGTKDKDRGNMEDYKREMNKAVQQLEQCASEDPNDFEAIGYLGWAYAELDSAGPAGKAFATAIAGLRTKGDMKKADWVSNNRESYWANAFNDGIAKIGQAQTVYLEYCKKPENESDETLKKEAGKKYEEALTSLTRASLLKPGNPQTLRTLGSVYAFTCDFATADKVFRAGLEVAPNDSSLLESVKSVRANRANQLLAEKKYNEAIEYYQELVKLDPKNSDLHLGLADAYFKRATEAKGDAAKAEYKAAADEYARAAALKPSDADLPFNAALAYQNAGAWDLAEAQWRATLKLRPDDVDAISALGASLSELKKFDEALRVLHDGVLKSPKNKTLHRQLGAVYTKVGNNPKSTEELMMYLALQRGKEVADVDNYLKYQIPKVPEMSKALSTSGKPDAVLQWPEDDSAVATFVVQETKISADSKLIKVTQLPPQNVWETWIYWSNGKALHFKGGSLVQKTDWTTLGAVPASAPTGKK